MFGTLRRAAPAEVRAYHLRGAGRSAEAFGLYLDAATARESGGRLQEAHALVEEALAALMASPALAQQITVKAGVLNDRSGVYADLSGEGSVIAKQERVSPATCGLSQRSFCAGVATSSIR